MAEHRSDKNKNKIKASTSTDSLESRRWIFHADSGDEDADANEADFDEYDEDLSPQHVLDSDEDDNVDFKLIRTEPKIDSFDVEALEVPGVQRNDYEVFFFLFSCDYILLVCVLLILMNCVLVDHREIMFK